MSAIPWKTWLHVAQRRGVPPKDFWCLSVVEWLAILSVADAAALSRTELAHLMRAFPDMETKHG